MANSEFTAGQRHRIEDARRIGLEAGKRLAAAMYPCSPADDDDVATLAKAAHDAYCDGLSRALELQVLKLQGMAHRRLATLNEQIARVGELLAVELAESPTSPEHRAEIEKMLEEYRETGERATHIEIADLDDQMDERVDAHEEPGQ